MTMETKKEVFDRYLREYLKASKRRKTEILNIVCETTGLIRKSAIRKFKRLQKKSAGHGQKRGRPVKYGPDTVSALKDVWTASSEICGELLHPSIKDFVDIMKRDDMWKHRPETTKKLLEMSEGMVKKKVGVFMKARHIRHGINATSPSVLKNIIPIFTGPWQDKPVGYGQVDTVVHCGSSLTGNMIFSVNYTDIATKWLGLRAQWNKGQIATQKSLQSIKDRLPFPLLGIHPDTGSEFINWHIKGWCDNQKIELTRSRPYHKNDNAHVEQKNGHVIRRFMGYNRLDTWELVDPVNEMYIHLETYLNHFIPTRKCLKKVRIGSKYKRTYDKAKTPYERVLAHPTMTMDVKNILQQEHEKLNPLILKEKIDKLISNIFKIQRQNGTQISVN